jgi:small-conductance mechanosensitive channel
MNNAVVSDAFVKMFRDSDPLDLLVKAVTMVLTVIFIILVFSLAQYALGRVLKGKISTQRTYMARKGIKYAGYVMAILFIFKSLGIDTSAILGAAGIAGIAFGFAAQTSVSSFISGLFLLSEKPFAVGDTIKVEDISGVVLSVDLLSVKIRTFDNLFIRIPNETIIKSNLVTISRFPIRRLDLSFSVAYKEDLERVEAQLLKLAAENQYCLDNPAPFVGIDTFADSGITLIFNLWADKNNLANLKKSILMAIKRSFEKEHIEIPYQKIDISISNTTGINEEHTE